MAPIDPVQLLNALASLLSPDGGIKSVEEVMRLSSLMKKFSKKLVSRCVYCNVLRATKPEILTAFLDENGWNTINVWLQDAKNSNNSPFLYELLQLCKVLPMTVERLKQNNTARLVKSLAKFENADVKELSSELVKKWMHIVQGETNATSYSGSEKKKKKKDKGPVEKERKEENKINKIERNLKVVLEKDLKVVAEKSLKESTLKEPAKVKGQKRSSRDKEAAEIYEDVKIDPEPLVKKAKTVDRPKTVKLFNKKFRATGLEEETPLPKPVNKKATAANKPVTVAAVKTAGVKRAHSSLTERISEKKIKPENLLNNVENSNQNGGIKLIPAKARPAHILHESASFMDALVAQPSALPKKKKKVPTNKPTTPPTPPSPTITPPKLQFYKDTLEMDENEDSVNKKSSNDTVSKDKASPPRDVKEETAEVSSEVDENPATPIDPGTSNIELSIDKEIEKEVDKVKNEELRSTESGPVRLRSILTHGKQPEKKKTVRWLDDANLKEVFYFDMDETERVNVNHAHQNFGDLKSLEMKREREAFEASRRQMGDRMEETIPWWIEPILIEALSPLVEPGCNSREKEIQLMKQQSTLQEIYFTREMVPDSPHEPELEIFTPQDPKVVPLDDEFHLGTLMDYSGTEMPAPKTNLPEVLTSLINIPKRKTFQQQQKLHIPEQPLIENNRIPQPHPSMNMGSPYDPVDPMPQVGLLGVAPPSHMFSSPPGPEMENGPLPNEWRPMEPMGGVMPPEQYFGPYPGNRPLLIDHMHQSIHSRGGDIRPRMNGPPPMVPEKYPPNVSKGSNMPWPTGSSRSSRPRVPCRHFVSGGCRYGANCNFLHPGVNGPLL